MAYLGKADVKALVELILGVGKWLLRGGNPMEPFDELPPGKMLLEVDKSIDCPLEGMLRIPFIVDPDKEEGLLNYRIVENKDKDVEKLIIKAAAYRAQVEYLLDNFVSTENVPTEFWMEIMDRYAADIMEKK